MSNHGPDPDGTDMYVDMVKDLELEITIRKGQMEREEQ
jgi:hypothetical protein